MSILHVPIKTSTQYNNATWHIHRENIQFSESVVKYNLINFLSLLVDMGSLSGAGRLFYNIGPLNLIDHFLNVDCTEDTCKLLQFRVL